MSRAPDAVPVIAIMAVAADRSLAEWLAGRLRTRGITVRLDDEPPPPAMGSGRLATVEACDALLIIISPAANQTGAFATEYQWALASGKPVIPLFVRSARDLPPDLRHVQAVDFSQSAEDGWLALLLVLDQRGMARYPRPAIPDLDAEVVRARLRGGRTPPTWTVTRTFVPGPRQLTRGTVIGALLVSAFTLLGVVLAGEPPLAIERYLLVPVGAYMVYLLYIRLSPPVRRLDKRGPAVVLTPEGIFIQNASGYVWASFAEARLASARGETPARSLLLTVHASTGPRTPTMTLEQLMGHSLQAQQALALYAAFAARYTPEGAPPAASAPGRLAPLIFLSYARADSALVDRLELALWQCGFSPWVDRSELIGGQEWSAEVRQALDQCAALIVVITPRAMRSAEVRREYTYALGAGKPVLGLMARSTRRIPAELRSRLAGDARPMLLHGILDLSRRLDNLGIAPAALTLPPGGHVSREPTLAVARALRGEPPPEGHVYRGRLPGRVYSSILTALLCAAILVWLYQTSDSIFFLWLLAVELAALGSGAIYYALRRWHYPDLVITLPDGFITFFGSGTILEYPYGSLSALTSGRASARRGTPLYCMLFSGQSVTAWLPPTLPERGRIVEQITGDFARYRERHAPVAAQPARGATVGRPLRPMG